MRFNIKIIILKKLYNFFWILALINIFFSTNNLHANTFSINDIEISTPFEINFNKNKIIDEGFIEAFNELILLTVKTKDQKKLSQIRLSTIKGMIETFSINEEKFIDEIYYLNVNVSFNKKKFFDLLESKNIFPSIPNKKNILFIPIILDQNKNEILMFSENYLFNNWNLNKKKYHLLNYILPTEDLDDFNLIRHKSNNLENYDFLEIIKKYNLKSYIIMIIFKKDQEIKILNKIHLSGSMDLQNLMFRDLNLNNKDELEKLIKNLKTIYENYWKSKNEINTSVKLSLTISIDNHDNVKISNFEKTLNDLDFIHNFYIYKINNKKNFYKIVFNGSPDNFLKIMRKNNYKFETQYKIWHLK